jgi:hypothetical protein
LKPWSAVVLAPPEAEGGPMASRIPTFLHPVAGRPLIWHSVSSLLVQAFPPEQVTVFTPPELGIDVFQDLPGPVRSAELDFGKGNGARPLDLPDSRLVVTHASAGITKEALRGLLMSEDGSWIAGRDGEPVALLTTPDELTRLLVHEQPFQAARTQLAEGSRLHGTAGVFQVRDRADLALAHRRIRDSLVQALMAAGVTFLLPESVVVDVDVRIGRDSIVYPGVTIEGQSTVGEETVIGPGCRIIDSWVGSGVELKGWNYIAHTSVRNRAILEPYVRRGFD